MLKFSLFTPWSRIGKGDVELHSFLTMAVHIGAWLISRSSRFVTADRTQVPTAYDLGRPHMRSGLSVGEKKISPLPGMEHRIVQPIPVIILTALS